MQYVSLTYLFVASGRGSRIPCDAHASSVLSFAVLLWLDTALKANQWDLCRTSERNLVREYEDWYWATLVKNKKLLRNPCSFCFMEINLYDCWGVTLIYDYLSVGVTTCVRVKLQVFSGSRKPPSLLGPKLQTQKSFIVCRTRKKIFFLYSNLNSNNAVRNHWKEIKRLKNFWKQIFLLVMPRKFLWSFICSCRGDLEKQHVFKKRAIKSKGRLKYLRQPVPENIGVARIFDWGAQTTNHMQWRLQKFSKKELFAEKRYCRMEDLKP